MNYNYLNPLLFNYYTHFTLTRFCDAKIIISILAFYLGAVLVILLYPSGRAIHVLQISTRIYWGIPGDHPCGNFLMISLRKFRGIFYVDISASFPCGIPGDISEWKFPSCFPQTFKMHLIDIGGVPAPSYVKISQ